MGMGWGLELGPKDIFPGVFRNTVLQSPEPQDRLVKFPNKYQTNVILNLTYVIELA